MPATVISGSARDYLEPTPAPRYEVLDRTDTYVYYLDLNTDRRSHAYYDCEGPCCRPVIAALRRQGDLPAEQGHYTPDDEVRVVEESASTWLDPDDLYEFINVLTDEPYADTYYTREPPMPTTTLNNPIAATFTGSEFDTRCIVRRVKETLTNEAFADISVGFSAACNTGYPSALTTVVDFISRNRSRRYTNSTMENMRAWAQVWSRYYREVPNTYEAGSTMVGRIDDQGGTYSNPPVFPVVFCLYGEEGIDLDTEVKRGGLIAAGALVPSEDDEWTFYGAVAEGVRGQGVGRGLLAAAEEVAIRQVSTSSLAAKVHNTNRAASACLAHEGWLVDGVTMGGVVTYRLTIR